MRQRNTSGHPLLVAGPVPVVVEPDGEVDHDEPLAGFTPTRARTAKPAAPTEESQA